MKTFTAKILYALLPTTLLLSLSAAAWQPDTALIRTLKAKYKGEHSVIINATETLEIKWEDGELVATSKTEQEKLLLTEAGVENENMLRTDRGYFNRLEDIDGQAFVPDARGNYKANRNFGVNVRSVEDGSFYDDYRIVTAIFTNVKKNSLIRLTTEHYHPEIAFLPWCIPDEYIPVERFVYKVIAPKFVNLKFAKHGTHLNWIQESRENKDGKVVYTFAYNQMPAMRVQSGTPSSLYYLPHVIPYITSFRLPGTNKDSVLLSDLDQAYKFKYKYFGNINIKKDTMLERLVANIIAGDKTQRKKAEHIYSWVQKNIHYVGFEAGLAGWIPREADTVCKRKFGDCKDMSSLIMAMCRLAGIDAHFTLIGTTHKPYLYTDLPLPVVSNHMICAVKLDGKWVFLDGTHANLPFGVDRADIQGKEAMIGIDAKTYNIVKIPEVNADANLSIDSSVLRFDSVNTTKIIGTVKQKRLGYPAWNFGYAIMGAKEDEKERIVKKIAERGSEKYVQEAYSLRVSDTGARNLSFTSKFHIDDYVQRAGKQYVINMNLQRTNSEHIDTAGRQVGWYFDYKKINREIVTLTIPKGFRVAYLPPSISKGEKGLWNYTITYKKMNDKIVLVKEIKWETLCIKPQYFDASNRLAESLDQQYKESVVLTTK
jgi:hypothetical protein